MSIANSPLVKTAIAGEDANWGRVVMAVGKAGEPADRDKLSIWFGGIRVAHKGARDPGYDEAKVSAAMKSPNISLKVDARPRPRQGPRADLRPHQGIRRDQRRLPLVSGRDLTHLLTSAARPRLYSIALNRLNPRLPTFGDEAVSVKIVLVAACALIDADGRVLIAQRPAGKSMAGLWEFPGGKVEAGERPEETLIRELQRGTRHRRARRRASRR